MKYLLFFLFIFCRPLEAFESTSSVAVGSKTFTESYILAEIVSQVIEGIGETKVQRKLGIGATGIIYESLRDGQIDIYPEYTGTISETIIKNQKLTTTEEINHALESDLKITESLGFDDNYALAARDEFARNNSIKNISDLKNHLDIRGGFTHEFMKRQDGLGALEKFYGMNLTKTKGMEHALAYESLSEKKIDLIEVYSTDAKIAKYGLVVLNDDKNFFPKYHAVLFYRKAFAEKYPKSFMALQNLVGQISEPKMIELNAKVELEKWSFSKTASYFLQKESTASPSTMTTFLQRTKEHLFLVFVSLIAAILAGVPLGILAARFRYLAQIVLLISGLMQTIPSLALLCFLIPVFGIGYLPAITALFLYALLPIVRNTYLGLKSIDQRLIESARTLGLSSYDRLRLVEVPLASPTILAGIKLSAVINVGTATLAAFIGAGGYGAIIVTGLALNNTQIILQGAIPSAILAIMVHLFFEFTDRWIIPRGLRV